MSSKICLRMHAKFSDSFGCCNPEVKSAVEARAAYLGVPFDIAKGAVNPDVPISKQ